MIFNENPWFSSRFTIGKSTIFDENPWSYLRPLPPFNVVMLKDANDSSVLNSILPNIERGQGGMNAKNVDFTQFWHTNDAYSTLNPTKCRFLRFYTFCYTNDAFYTLKSIFTQCCILHLEMTFFMKLTKFPREVATNLREKWSILPREMNFYKPDRLETRKSFSSLIFDIYRRILPLKIFKKSLQAATRFFFISHWKISKKSPKIVRRPQIQPEPAPHPHLILEKIAPGTRFCSFHLLFFFHTKMLAT